MKPAKLPLAGRCRCGEVKVAASAPPLLTAACHCTGCQSMSGSAFSLSATFPAKAFTVEAGETVLGGLRGPQLQHHFCPTCMTWMFTRVVGFDAFVNVRPTLFDDRSWFVPFIETMTAERMPWALTPARHRYEGFPPFEEFERLMREFAELG